ncbi:hypothetical protein D8X55_03000 [Malacoplasma penetrans]|uniref:P116 family lipid acquisition surface protein n=1 Tax=Malacoplasma penetrans TaxID=28227 RepID=UPI0010111C49|nr:hypothetical protein [Malacoplasma penetrans]RXY96659.1 hypothetical protein D8X55_03000 [Malacoplasma penetrans]
MINKKHLIKISYLFTLAVPIAISVAAATTTKDVVNNNSSTNTTYPNFNNNKKGSIPSSLASLNSNAITDFNYISSNEYGIQQNFDDFSQNYNLATHTGSESGVKNDINYFGYLIWNQNSRSFTISSIEVNNYQISDLENSKVVFDKTKVSFDLTVNILGIQDASINVLNKTYNLSANNTYQLKVSVKDQVLKSCVNNLTDEFLVGWQVDNATISFNNDSYVGTFTPTLHSFSFSFPYKVKGLTGKQNYLQLYSKHESEILNLSKNDLKNHLKTKFNSEYQNTMDYIENGIQILGILASNPTVKDLIYKSIPYATKILVAANFLPSYLSPLINDALGDSNKPFLEVIKEYKSVILQFLEEMVGSVVSVAGTYIDLFKPNITSDSAEYKSIKSFFTTLALSEDNQNAIFKDIIGVDGSKPLSLVDFLYNNLDLVLKIVDPTYTPETNTNTKDTSDNSSDSSTSTTTSPIVTILKLLLSKNTTTNQYNKFFDVLSGPEKTEFYNAIIQLVGSTDSQISQILGLITQSNANLTTDNIVKFVSSLHAAIQEMFARNENYKNFYDKDAYKNLTFHTSFAKDPEIDKTKKTISFDYKIYYTLNKKIDFSPVIAAFKNLLTVDTISALIKQFTSTDLDSIVGSIPVVGDFAKARVIKALMQYIPDNIWIGANSNEAFYKQNKTTVSFSSSGSNIWFYPIRVGTNYKLGYQFEFNKNVKMDDPSFTQSITSNYNSKTNSVSLISVDISNSSWSLSTDIAIDFYFRDFWKNFLKNVVLRDYDFAEIFTSDQVNDQNIATIETYSPDLYTTGFALENTMSSIVTDDVLKEFEVDKNTTQVVSDYMSTGALYKWKDGNDSSSLYGAKPKLSDALKTSLTSKMYKLVNQESFNKMSDNTNLSVSATIDPIMNFNLPLKVYQADYGVDVDIKIRMTTVSFNVYSPIKFYDTTSKTLVNGFSHLISHIG